RIYLRIDISPREVLLTCTGRLGQMWGSWMSSVEAPSDAMPEDIFAREVAEPLHPRLWGQVAHEAIEEEARVTYRNLTQGARIMDFIPILGERDVFLRFRS